MAAACSNWDYNHVSCAIMSFSLSSLRHRLESRTGILLLLYLRTLLMSFPSILLSAWSRSEASWNPPEQLEKNQNKWDRNQPYRYTNIFDTSCLRSGWRTTSNLSLLLQSSFASLKQFWETKSISSIRRMLALLKRLIWRAKLCDRQKDKLRPFTSWGGGSRNETIIYVSKSDSGRHTGRQKDGGEGGDRQRKEQDRQTQITAWRGNPPPSSKQQTETNNLETHVTVACKNET